MDVQKILEALSAPETFEALNGTTDTETWFTSVIVEAMAMLWNLTGEDDLECAISNGKIYASSDDETSQLMMLTLFVRKEKSGNLKPPPSLSRLYHEVIKAINKNA